MCRAIPLTFKIESKLYKNHLVRRHNNRLLRCGEYITIIGVAETRIDGPAPKRHGAVVGDDRREPRERTFEIAGYEPVHASPAPTDAGVGERTMSPPVIGCLACQRTLGACAFHLAEQGSVSPMTALAVCGRNAADGPPRDEPADDFRQRLSRLRVAGPVPPGTQS